MNLLMSLFLVSGVAQAAGKDKDRDCEALLLSADAVAELQGWPRDLNRSTARNQVNHLIAQLKKSKPSADAVLMHWEALTQTALELRRTQFLQPHTNIEADLNFVFKTMAAALKKSSATPAQILKTVRLDWEHRQSEQGMFGLKFNLASEMVESLKLFLNAFTSDPHDLDTIDDVFMLKSIRAQISALVESDAKPLRIDPSLYVTADWAIGDKFKRWINGQYIVLDASIRELEDREIAHMFFAQVDLALKIRGWLGMKPSDHLSLAPLKFVADIESVNTDEFDKVFPSPTVYSEDLYASGASSDFEKAIVKAIFRRPKFKQELFEKLNPSWKNEPLMQHWLSYTRPDEIQALLEELSAEGPRANQVVDKYLRESNLSLKSVRENKLLQIYYGDEIVRVLSRYSGEQRKEAVQGSKLSELPLRLRASFISRVPEDLNLGRRTGDCTSFRSLNFSNSLRWLSSTAGQVVTFHLGKHFLAKAHLVIFNGEKTNYLVLDAFEINPQGQEKGPLRNVISENLPKMMEVIAELGSRMQRKVLLSPITNFAWVRDYIENFPKADLGEDNVLQADLPFDAAGTRAFLAQMSGIDVGKPSSEFDSFESEIFLQSFDNSNVDFASDEVKILKDLKVRKNFDLLAMLEDEVRREIEISGSWLPPELKSARLADLASRDPHLEKVREALTRVFGNPDHSQDVFGDEDDPVNAYMVTLLSGKAHEAIQGADLAADMLEDEVFDMFESYRIPQFQFNSENRDLFRKLLQLRIVYLNYFGRYEAAQSKSGKSSQYGWPAGIELHELGR